MLSSVRSTVAGRLALSKFLHLNPFASSRDQSPSSRLFCRRNSSGSRPIQDLSPPSNMTQAPSVHPFDPKLPSVSVRRSDGGTASYNVHLTPKAKPEKLLPALESLLSQINPAGGRSERDSWILDEGGDAIHRHFAFKHEGDAHTFRSLLMAVADEMNHHPHVSGDAIMTVTCTTHNPRGLSMRDVRLATKIEDLAANFELYKPPSSDGAISASDLWRDQRLVNRAAIDKVLSDRSGACFISEKRPG